MYSCWHVAFSLSIFPTLFCYSPPLVPTHLNIAITIAISDHISHRHIDLPDPSPSYSKWIPTPQGPEWTYKGFSSKNPDPSELHIYNLASSNALAAAFSTSTNR